MVGCAVRAGVTGPPLGLGRILKDMAKKGERPNLTIVVEIPGSDRDAYDAVRAARERDAAAVVGGRVRVTHTTMMLSLIREAAKKLEAA